MPKTTPPSTPSGNRLLALLPADDYQRLLPFLQVVPLEFKKILYEAGAPIDYAYFPFRGTLSAVTVMEDGNMIEVATIGNEGMTGLPILLETDVSPNRVIVQVLGDGLRMRAEDLKDQIRQPGPLRKLLAQYHAAFLTQVSQSVACNGLHTVQQRCCRWLLLTHDRIGADELPLTQEFLAIMLGVRRASVTEVLQPLQEKGLVRVRRGKMIVLDRAGLEATACECYRSVQAQFDRLLGGGHAVTA